MAAEVSLAPNLLSLYRCQSLYCLHIAKTPTPGTEIRRIRSTSGQHSSWHLYLPNRPGAFRSQWGKSPDICSRNGYHRPRQAYLPNRPGALRSQWGKSPDVCSSNGYHRPRQAYLPNRPDTPRSQWVLTNWGSQATPPKKADTEQNCLSAVLSGVCLCLFFIQEFPYSV